MPKQSCMFCHGTGFVYAPTKRKCRVCHGNGFLVFALLACLLAVACGDNAPAAPDATIDAQRGDTVGDAIRVAAEAQCRALARCTGAQVSACPTDGQVVHVVGVYCSSHDCHVHYASWNQLDACVAQMDSLGCSTTASCPL